MSFFGKESVNKVHCAATGSFLPLATRTIDLPESEESTLYSTRSWLQVTARGREPLS
jgi:hypothetical protein